MKDINSIYKMPYFLFTGSFVNLSNKYSDILTYNKLRFLKERSIEFTIKLFSES